MRRLFFTPVGTSCLNRIPSELRSASFDEKFDWATNYLKAVYWQDPKNVMTYSAEINSLLKRDISPNDIIQLFCTDTDEGRLSGEILQDFFQSEIGCEVLLTVVPGLQAMDSMKFRNLGVKSYIEELLASYNKYRYSHDIVMNIAGGLKNVIPYSTIASMLLSIPIYYIFEHSDAIMELPTIPITLDFSLFEKHHLIFSDLVEQGAIKEATFFQKVSYEEREPLKLLVEKNQKHITFTALGLLLWDRYIEQFPPQPTATSLQIKEKNIKLADHHGKDRLVEIAKKLVLCEYVEGISRCDEFQPYARKFVDKYIEPSEIRVVDYKSDEGFSMVVKTTAQDRRELYFIGKKLAAYYD